MSGPDPSLQAPEDRVEILPERAPGQPIHGEVVDDHEEALAVLAEVERRDPQQRPLPEAEAAPASRRRVARSPPVARARAVPERSWFENGRGSVVGAIEASQPLLPSWKRMRRAWWRSIRRSTTWRTSSRVERLGPLEQHAQVPVVGIGELRSTRKRATLGSKGRGASAGARSATAGTAWRAG